MKFLSLFSGIGGFDLGLEWAGWECVGQVEINPYCQKVLRKHWPKVWRFEDVRQLTGEFIRKHCGHIDAIIGGVPCQPSSQAGKRLGTSDDRWLWPDFLRLVSEVYPLWVLAENPRGVLTIDVDGSQFKDWIAREFQNRDYNFIPVELAAEDVGASQHRERIWFLANANNQRRQRAVRQGESNQTWKERETPRGESLRSACGFWPPGPRKVADIPRMVDGAAHRMDRCRGLGNAVVPQVAEVIGKAVNLMTLNFTNVGDEDLTPFSS